MDEKYLFGSFILILVIDYLLLLAFETILIKREKRHLKYFFVAVVTALVNVGYIWFLLEYIKND